MKVLICGGRDFEDYALMRNTLSQFQLEKSLITHVVTGAQRKRGTISHFCGADWLAIEWALAWEIPFSGIPAKWTYEGKSAGPRRNSRMLAQHPDIEWVIHFPGGTGTADMLEAAREKRIPVYPALWPD